MFRTTDIVLIAVMVAAAGFTYTTKHGAESQLSKVRTLEAAIRFEEETIDVLKADWSLLTQPARLQRLAEFYHSELQLVPVEAHQIADFSELPPRPVNIPEVPDDKLDGIAGIGIDQTTVTGGIAQ